MLECRQIFQDIRVRPPSKIQDADLGFKLVQAAALVEIAEALTNIADLLLEAENKEKNRPQEGR